MSAYPDAAPHEAEEHGFKRMSHIADSMDDAAATEASYGAQAGDGIGSLQQMVEDEIRERPFRALGWAAAAGLLVGIMAAR